MTPLFLLHLLSQCSGHWHHCSSFISPSQFLVQIYERSDSFERRVTMRKWMAQYRSGKGAQLGMCHLLVSGVSSILVTIKPVDMDICGYHTHQALVWVQNVAYMYNVCMKLFVRLSLAGIYSTRILPNSLPCIPRPVEFLMLIAKHMCGCMSTVASIGLPRLKVDDMRGWIQHRLRQGSSPLPPSSHHISYCCKCRASLKPSINCSHGSLKEGLEVKDKGNKPLLTFVSKSATNDMFFLIVEGEVQLEAWIEQEVEYNVNQLWISRNK